MAFDALEAAYAVLYNQPRRVDTAVTTGEPIPHTVFSAFPVYVAALINSLGPFESKSLPSRRTHVLFMRHAEVEACRPAYYAGHLSARFRMECLESTFLLSSIEPAGTDRWTFWDTKVNDTTFQDYSLDTGNTLASYRIWSPIRSDDV